VFKNAQGKFDGRIFMGICLGLGSFVGLVIKLWMSFEGGIPPFWLWAVPGLIVLMGVSVWLSTRRRDAQLRERLERSARVQAMRRSGDDPASPTADAPTE
jgi:hypothetical protein